LRDLEHAGRVCTSPGISTEVMDLYLAPYSAADRVHAGLASESEHLEFTELSLDTLWSMAEREEINHLKTLTLVLMLRIRHPELFRCEQRAVMFLADERAALVDMGRHLGMFQRAHRP
jgi:hypothetical protein